jgi:hypothetical protein
MLFNYNLTGDYFTQKPYFYSYKGGQIISYGNRLFTFDILGIYEVY